MDGEKVHSCQKTLADADDKLVQTIEGFAKANPEHPILKAWTNLEVAQCGFCQPGMVMAAASTGSASSSRNLNSTWRRGGLAEGSDGMAALSGGGDAVPGYARRCRWPQADVLTRRDRMATGGRVCRAGLRAAFRRTYAGRAGGAPERGWESPARWGGVRGRNLSFGSDILVA